MSSEPQVPIETPDIYDGAWTYGGMVLSEEEAWRRYRAAWTVWAGGEMPSLRARLAAAEARTMDDLQGRIGEWQRATFPNPNGELGPTVRHARSEVLELVEICELIDKYGRAASAIGEPVHSKLREEAADVFLLLCGVAEIGGFSLRSAAEQKLAINRNRKWGERNAEGFIEHVSDPRTDAGADWGGEG